MPRKILRLSALSLVSRNRTVPSDAFEFEVEPFDSKFSFREKSDERAKKTHSKIVPSSEFHEILRNSASSEGSENAEEKTISRKRKHRVARKLNNFETGDTYFQTVVDAKSKKTKKSRGRSTTDSDHKENEAVVRNDLKRKRKPRRNRKITSAEKLSEQADIITSGSDSVFFSSSDNKETHTDTDSHEENPVVQDNTVGTSLFAGRPFNSPPIKCPLNAKNCSDEFNKRNSSNEILNNLNITTRDSRKSSYKKSSTGFKFSSGSEEVDNKFRFVTLRRPYQTFTHSSDFARSPDIALVSDASRTPKPRKSILKKPLERTNDTFEILERYCEVIAAKDESPCVLATSTVTKETLPWPVKTVDHRDIFDVASSTHELDHQMLGSGDSDLLTISFVNQMKTSIAPRLTRNNTFTKDEEFEPSELISTRTPQPQGTKNTQEEKMLEPHQSEQRKSARKRWSQGERVPIFGKMPPANFNNTSSSQFAPTPSKPKNMTPKVLTRKKSVRIESQTSITNAKTASFCESLMAPAGLQSTITEKKAKGKKSVKIESPLKTPKTRPHTSLVIRKTPMPNQKLHNETILAANCAFSKSPSLVASTPFRSKKEASLFKKVLTNEKSKADKSTQASVSKVKMPNFLKIHKKQFEKMENIKDLQERKARRAQCLMSGHKPVASMSVTSNVEKESKKKLIFTPSEDPQKKISKPAQHMLKKRASVEKKQKELKSKVPVLVPHFGLAKDKPQTHPQKPASQLKEPVFNKKYLPQKKAIVETKVRTKATNMLKDELIKVVATKSKIAVNRTERNRKQMAQYRTNRRYDLLLQMRAQEAQSVKK